MRMQLKEVEPINVPPVDNDEAAAFMRHLTGNETLDFSGCQQPRLMIIYSLKYAWPHHSFAHGWLLSIDYETLASLSGSDEYGTMEPIMKRFLVGTIGIELGGTLPSPTVSAKPVSLGVEEESRKREEGESKSKTSKAEYDSAKHAYEDLRRQCKKAKPVWGGFLASILGRGSDNAPYDALVSQTKEAEIRVRNAEAHMKEALGRLPPITLPGNVTIDFIRVPSGFFQMGSASGWKAEQPQHRVMIMKDFCLGKYTVTQAQWWAVMGSAPSHFKGDNLPVERVSWDDCQEFIRKLNALGQGAFRLPSEAEWEYACRAGSTAAYCFGDNESLLVDYAWIKKNSDDWIHPVGEKKPNAWGLYDMHGNVYEWCQDWDHDNYSGAPTDGSAWESPRAKNRVQRGGAWQSDDADDCRAASRSSYAPDGRLSIIGVRLARTL